MVIAVANIIPGWPVQLNWIGRLFLWAAGLAVGYTATSWCATAESDWGNWPNARWLLGIS